MADEVTSPVAGSSADMSGVGDGAASAASAAAGEAGSSQGSLGLSGGEADPSLLSSGGEAPASKPSADYEGWKNLIGEEFRADQTINALPDTKEGLAQMAKMLYHSQRLVGADKVILPGKNSSQQDWDTFYTRIGRPGDPAGYELDKIEIPDSFITPEDPNTAKQLKDSTAQMYAKLMHEAGCTKQQAEKIYGGMAEVMRTMNATVESEMTKEIESHNARLSAEWGNEGTPKWEQNKAVANRAYQQFASDEDNDYLNKSGLIHDPVFNMIMARVGQGMLEDNAMNPGNQGAFVTTADKATSRLREIYSQRDTHAYFDNRNPMHNQAVAEVKSLFEAGGKL